MLTRSHSKTGESASKYLEEQAKQPDTWAEPVFRSYMHWFNLTDTDGSGCITLENLKVCHVALVKTTCH